jgi:hypothetical protein
VWTFATQNYGANIAANLIYIGKQRSNLTVHCAIDRIVWRTIQPDVQHASTF